MTNNLIPFRLSWTSDTGRQSVKVTLRTITQPGGSKTAFRSGLSFHLPEHDTDPILFLHSMAAAIEQLNQEVLSYEPKELQPIKIDIKLEADD